MTSEENKKESYHDFEKQRQSTNSVHLLLVSNSQILLDFLPTSQLPHDFISNFSFMVCVIERNFQNKTKQNKSIWELGTKLNPIKTQHNREIRPRENHRTRLSILESSQVRVDEITQSNSRWTSVSRCSMEKLKMKKKRVHRIRVSNRRDRQIGEKGKVTA
ncbi:hypothetical protein HID58_083426 [Brassica napus]|uniref:Uncharacterized protein n=1 Tax=Brassica napus TaxID=3708 RepID=A0ABQ7YDF9_BRANA|nr:hypothetical protein HID58_083426 [Brassica napus]